MEEMYPLSIATVQDQSRHTYTCVVFLWSSSWITCIDTYIIGLKNLVWLLGVGLEIPRQMQFPHTQVASGNRYSSSSKSDHIITCGIGCRVRSGGALPWLLLAFLDPVRGSQELLGSVPGQTTQPAPPPDLPSLSEDKIFQNLSQNRICPPCWIDRALYF